MNALEEVALMQIKESLYKIFKEINDPNNEKRQGYYVLMPIKTEAIKIDNLLKALIENNK